MSEFTERPETGKVLPGKGKVFPQPECPYCGAIEGLRKLHDGYGSEPPEYTCEECFTAMDDGPGFDDLEPVT